MSQRVKTSARGLVLPRSSSPENGHLRKNLCSYIERFELMRLTHTTILIN
jgi:hypothetical protein